MGLVEWVALGYLVLLLVAGLLTASLCRIAQLSGRHSENTRREVLVWGSLPPLGNAAIRDRLSHLHRLRSPGLSPLA